MADFRNILAFSGSKPTGDVPIPPFSTHPYFDK
jgi:hypothetical protein